MKIPREKLCLYSSPYSDRSSSEEMIRLAAAKGLGGIEMMNFCSELEGGDMAEAKRLGALAKSLGLYIPCFSVGLNIISAPQEKTARAKRYADICSALEIPYLHHTIALDFSSGDISEEERESRFKLGSECALEIADYAQSLGVRTLIECQGFVFNGIKNCRRLVELSGGKIGIVADVGNICFYDEEPAPFIRAMGDLVCNAHLKDFDKKPEPTEGRDSYPVRHGGYLTDAEIGTGILNFDEIEAAFADIGYKGSYSLEFAHASDEEVDRVINRFAI